MATLAKILAAVVAVVLVSGVSVAAIATWDVVSSAKPSVHLVGEKKQPIPDIAAIKGGVNILIAASDTRTGQGDTYGTTEDSAGAGLNDVTMLLHLSQDHTHATVISFPRDMMIPIPKCPDGKGGWNSAMSKRPLNSTLDEGGLACTVLTIDQLTGLDIPFAGVITFTGVVAMSNAVGGVPVCIANGGIHDPDTDLNLNAGEYNLQGVQAAQFLRTRHGVGDGSDLSRISNQQVFLSSLVRTIKSDGTMTNPAKLWALAKATVSNVQLSDQLNNVTTLYQIALALKDLSFDNIVFLQYPTFADPDDSNKVVPDSDSADVIFEALAKDQPIQLSGGTGDGSIVNPDATQQPPTPAATAPPADAAAPTDSSSAAGSPVVLPDTVHGQTAATQTCSNGNN